MFYLSVNFIKFVSIDFEKICDRQMMVRRQCDFNMLPIHPAGTVLLLLSAACKVMYTCWMLRAFCSKQKAIVFYSEPLTSALPFACTAPNYAYKITKGI